MAAIDRRTFSIRLSPVSSREGTAVIGGLFFDTRCFRHRCLFPNVAALALPFDNVDARGLTLTGSIDTV